MKRKTVLAGLFVVLLSSVGHLQARGFAHFGAGHFGRHGGKTFGFGIDRFGHPGLGFHNRRFCNSGLGLGHHTPFHGSRFCDSFFGLGYYSAPFYGYRYYSSPDYGYVTPSLAYDEGYNSQPDQGNSPKVNPKTDCTDTWTETRREDSLTNAIRSAFQSQCENMHAASESSSLQEDSLD
jgi:hypothetical protein